MISVASDNPGISMERKNRKSCPSPSGIELANKIKKGQFDTSEVTGPGAMILQVWEAVLAA
jgi:hypothetical protein